MKVSKEKTACTSSYVRSLIRSVHRHNSRRTQPFFFAKHQRWHRHQSVSSVACKRTYYHSTVPCCEWQFRRIGPAQQHPVRQTSKYRSRRFSPAKRRIARSAQPTRPPRHTLARAEFRRQCAEVKRSDFRTIEYLVRKGRKHVKLLQMPGVKGTSSYGGGGAR